MVVSGFVSRGALAHRAELPARVGVVVLVEESAGEPRRPVFALDFHFLFLVEWQGVVRKRAAA